MVMKLLPCMSGSMSTVGDGCEHLLVFGANERGSFVSRTSVCHFDVQHYDLLISLI
jgi:hypothetical protein